MLQTPQQEHKTTVQEPLFPLSETLIAAEYSALRGEILQLTQIQFQIIVIAISAFGTVLPIGLQLNSAPILLVYPILALLLFLIWISHAYGVDMLGSYIQNVIERRVGTGNIGWENASRAKLPAHAAIAFRFSRWSIFSMQIIASLAGLSVTMSNRTPLNIILTGLAAICTACTFILCERTSRTQGEGKRLSEVHAEIIEKVAETTTAKVTEAITEKTAGKAAEKKTEKVIETTAEKKTEKVIYEIPKQNP